MTNLTIDFNAVNPLSSGNSPGETGENNAVTLTVIPETAMTENVEVVSYYIMFGTKDGVIPSASLPQSFEPLVLSLSDAVTKYKSLNVQLWAMNSDGAILMKSRMVHLFLKPSVAGEFVGDDSGTLLAQIAEFLNNHYSNAEIDMLISGVLPTVTAADNGDFLCVVNGAWAKTTLNNAREVDYLDSLHGSD